MGVPVRANTLIAKWLFTPAVSLSYYNKVVGLTNTNEGEASAKHNVLFSPVVYL